MKVLLSFGEVLVDLLPTDATGKQHQPIAGGAPANVAVGYAKLGGKSYFAGGISTDPYGVMLTAALAEQGVATDYLAEVPGAPTATVQVYLDEQGERTFEFNRNGTADMRYSKQHFDTIPWQGIDIFHLCSNTFTETALFNTSLYGAHCANAFNKLVSFDVNLRLSLWQDTSLLAERVERCFSHTQVLKMSREEADYLALARDKSLARAREMSLAEARSSSGKNSFEDYLQFCLAQGVEVILVTDGANPVQCISARQRFSVPVPQIAAVDTTAAGDSFISGFLFALGLELEYDLEHLTLLQRLESRAHLEAAVAFAIRCGAMTCGQKGAFPALPTLAQIG
ncbi:carbohydrate kinase [Shewanella sp. AS16]|uniref:carbohydrate kinase family protein n=1 Tax=Shewanella sp. AS16 TaxID=2907625 RepID=UPI001F38F5D4|nr:carbohydrate kinase [Shewanella sp. AS16]MCE9688141.1 carbohydrate kinase [Shewanella sp. AS16]